MLDFNRRFGQNLHAGFAVHSFEYRAQRFVAMSDFVEYLLQSFQIQRPVDPKCRGNVVGSVIGIELVQKPQTLLGKGQGQFAAALNGHNGQFFHAFLLQLQLVDGATQLVYHGMFEQNF